MEEESGIHWKDMVARIFPLSLIRVKHYLSDLRAIYNTFDAKYRMKSGSVRKASF